MVESNLSERERRLDSGNLVRDILEGAVSVVGADKRNDYLNLTEGRFYGDCQDFSFNSGKYRLRLVRRDEGKYRLTLTVLNPRVGVSDVIKGINSVQSYPAMQRVGFGDVGHDGINIVIPFNIPETTSYAKASRLFLGIIDCLSYGPLREVSSSDSGRDRPKGKKWKKRKRGSIFPDNGATNL